MESDFEQKKIRQSNSNFLATLSDRGVDVVVSISSQASIRLLRQLAFAVYFQNPTIVIVIMICLVCQTVTMAISGFGKSEKAPYFGPEKTSWRSSF